MSELRKVINSPRGGGTVDHLFGILRDHFLHNVRDNVQELLVFVLQPTQHLGQCSHFAKVSDHASFESLLTDQIVQHQKGVFEAGMFRNGNASHQFLEATRAIGIDLNLEPKRRRWANAKRQKRN